MRRGQSVSGAPKSIKSHPEFSREKNEQERGPAVSSPRQKGGKHMEMKNHGKKENPYDR
jgi:hypothetical protein